MKILILCTGNSCRSQMAEGFLQSFHPKIEVFSAGTRPSQNIHPKAIEAMAEKGIDISSNQPENVDKYLDMSFDFVITVCGGAKDSCPMFTGSVAETLHIGFEDPADATGSEEEVLSVFRRIRDEIETDFKEFFKNKVESILQETA